MTAKVQLEPEAEEFAKATANPPFLFDLGPEKGRETVDEVQAGPVAKLPVDVEELTIPGGPGGKVSIRIVRPHNATSEQLRGLPTALVINGEADVLRDEGEAYANKPRAAGVRVTAARFQGTIHDFVMLNALADSGAARGAIALATGWLREGFAEPS